MDALTLTQLITRPSRDATCTKALLPSHLVRESRLLHYVSKYQQWTDVREITTRATVGCRKMNKMNISRYQSIACFCACVLNNWYLCLLRAMQNVLAGLDKSSCLVTIGLLSGKYLNTYNEANQQGLSAGFVQRYLSNRKYRPRFSIILLR